MHVGYVLVSPEVYGCQCSSGSKSWHSSLMFLLMQLTAYHESGHAVVAFNTQGANPIHKATITPRGMSLGMVTQLPDKDETSVSKRQMLARLDVCMGGRVAEEMVFGPDQVTSGARSDLQQATALARHMVMSSLLVSDFCT